MRDHNHSPVPSQAAGQNGESAGSSVPVQRSAAENQAEAAPSSQPEEHKTANPVVIRWDTSSAKDDQTTCAKLTLPLTPGAEADLTRLVQHSQPATFGRRGREIYDESHRKSLKMDPTTFCTTLDPYSLGIIDTVAQVLLPSVFDCITRRAVQAELYRLNVSPMLFPS